jgi:hypothetical protein
MDTLVNMPVVRLSQSVEDGSGNEWLLTQLGNAEPMEKHLVNVRSIVQCLLKNDPRPFVESMGLKYEILFALIRGN